MQSPVRITFRSMPQSPALSTFLRERAERLEHFFDRIISCHIVIEPEGHHRHSGDRFRFSIHVGLPGHEILVTRAPSEDSARDAYATSERAFCEAERQLEDWVTRQRDRRLHRVAAHFPSDARALD
jgi:ribosomal subunit interface protein